jgi:hypothetical protein
MDDEPLHLVDLDEPAEPDRPAAVPPGVVACAECTILIGPGYIETEPFPHPHGAGVVCGACLASLERRAQRPPALGPQSLGASARRFR